MLRYMRLLRLFFSTALLKEASFRGDFLIKILYTAINLTGTIGGSRSSFPTQIRLTVGLLRIRWHYRACTILFWQ